MNIQTTFKKISGIGFHKSKAWVIVLVVFIFLGLSALPVAALDPVMDPIGQPEAAGPISELPNDQFAPVIAYADPPVNKYLAVWEQVYSYDPIDYDIYARLVDENGIPIGDDVNIIANTGYMETHPSVAYSPAMNQYLIVWGVKYSDTDHRIYARRVNSDGYLVGDRIDVAVTDEYNEKPVITYNPYTHEYLVVYERRAGAWEFYHQDLYAQRVYEDGTLMGGEIPIATGGLDEQAAAVTCDGVEYLVVWQGDQEFTTETNVNGQRMGSFGSLIGGLLSISTWSGDQIVPRVTYNGYDHQYLVVWEDQRATPWGIYGQRLDLAGNLVGYEIDIKTDELKNTDPDVAYLPAIRSYLVVWQYEWSISDHDIHGIRVAYDGSIPPDSEYIITSELTEEKHPVVASSGVDNGLVAWEDWRNNIDPGGTGVDIFGSVETLSVPTFSGGVYEGDAGVFTTPLPGVSMRLGCSNDYGYFGELIAETVTNEFGEYWLPDPVICEYYNIQEIDPAGYYSIASQSGGGEIFNSNWLYYTYPLAGKVLTGNYFWDKPLGPGDDTPPGNWANFQPAGWVNVQIVEVSEQVEDTYSGLDVSTAEFNYSTDGGGSWSGWSPATITGNDGTTDPQVISTSVPFGIDTAFEGQNLVQFLVSDMAGNPGLGPIHVVKIDSVAPLNPTAVNCPTHPENVWTSNSLVTCNWSGATDATSGIAGYNIDWDTDPNSIPNPYLEIIDEEADSGPLSDGIWYFHVRAIDLAGNPASGAVHYGPILIDTEAPTAWVTTSGGVMNNRTINVGWAGGDTTSGVESYDVQTDIDGAGWTDWQVDTSATTALYTGDNGQEVYFRVHAYDAAGNVSEWSSTISIYFGVDVVVRVQNESGTNLSGAKVYQQGGYIGLTGASGTIPARDVLIGDTLAANYLVYTAPAGKPSHSMDGSISWAWRVYLTSVQIPDSGTPQLFEVSNTNNDQLLIVRKDQALIGVHIVAVALWDANSAYLADLKQGLLSASAYLYDVTDGQMFFEMIEIYDDEEMGAANDYIMYTDNTVWPNAFVSAITQKTGRMYFPPIFGSSWSSRFAYGTLIHEFGHYGLWLYDEYLDRNGNGGGYCTLNRNTSNDETTRASIMDDSDDASELCSNADPTHLHNPDTEQDAANNGESTWETVMRVYKDQVTPNRWTLQSPDTRNVAVVPGPIALPIADWVKVYMHDNVTNACDPFTAQVVYGDNTPASGAEVTVYSWPGKILGQGLTDTSGQITVRGAHNGDSLGAKKGRDSGTLIISCTPTVTGEQSPAALPTVVLMPDPYKIWMEYQPLIMTEDSVEVRVRSSIVFPTNPQVQVWQDGVADSMIVDLTYDSESKIYIGQFTLDPDREPKGFGLVEANDGKGNIVDRTFPYAIQIIRDDLLNRLISSDGRMEILLPVGSMLGNPMAIIQTADETNMEQNGMLLASKLYEVTIWTGENALQLPAAVNIYFSEDQFSIQQNQALGLYQWDSTNQKWILISRNVDMKNHFVSGQITQLGTFAIFTQPVYTLHLPLITR